MAGKEQVVLVMDVIDQVCSLLVTGTGMEVGLGPRRYNQLEPMWDCGYLWGRRGVVTGS